MLCKIYVLVCDMMCWFTYVRSRVVTGTYRVLFWHCTEYVLYCTASLQTMFGLMCCVLVGMITNIVHHMTESCFTIRSLCCCVSLSNSWKYYHTTVRRFNVGWLTDRNFFKLFWPTQHFFWSTLCTKSSLVSCMQNKS